MAEIIGLTASIVTLAGAGAKLADTLLKVANIIESAEYEARLIATDIWVFSSSLTQLSKVLEIPNPETDRLREITVVLTAACKSLIEDLTVLIGDPLPYKTTRRTFIIPFLRIRFRWMVHGAKVSFVKSLIDSFKSTIILLVSSIDLAVALHRNAPNSISESLKIQVESNIEFAEDAIENLHRCKDSQWKEEPSLTLTEFSMHSREIEDLAPETEGALVLQSSDSCSNYSEDHAAHQMIDGCNPKIGMEDHNSAALDDARSDEENYDLQFSPGCTRILQIQEMTYKLAKDILNYPALRPTWSWNLSPHVSNEEKLPTGANSSPKTHILASSETLYRSVDTTRPEALDGRLPPKYQNDQDSNQDTFEYLPSIKTTLDDMSDPKTNSPKLQYSDAASRIAYLEAVAKEPQNASSFSKQVPAPSSAMPPPAPPPPDLFQEESVIARLEALLLGKKEEEEKKRAEDAKFARLERLLVAQQEAQMEKERAKKRAADEAAQQAIEAKRKGDEDKLAKLEMLILAQKDEQLKREAAAEAARHAEKAEADARVAKEAADKQAQAEVAAKLLEAAKKAREEAEHKAAIEGKKAKEAHGRALAEARAVVEELEQEKKLAKNVAAARRNNGLPLLFEDAIGRKFSCPWHICNLWKGMEEFITQISVGVDAISELVESGEYDLVKDGHVIPPQLWEDMVHPGSSITMCARNMSRSPLPKISTSAIPVRTGNSSKKVSWLLKSVGKNGD